jgi:hypothetical protein
VSIVVRHEGGLMAGPMLREGRYPALRLGGAVSDRISVPDAASIQNLSAFTWLGWLLLERVQSGDTLWAKPQNGTTTKYRMTVSGTSGDVSIIARRTGVVTYTTNSTPLKRTFVWHYCAILWDVAAAAGSLYRLYVGDEQRPALAQTFGTATDSSGSLVSDAGQAYLLGNGPAFGAGALWQVGPHALYNRVLDPQEFLAWQFDPLLSFRGEVLHVVPGLRSSLSILDYSVQKNHGAASVTTTQPRQGPRLLDAWKRRFPVLGRSGGTTPVSGSVDCSYEALQSLAASSTLSLEVLQSLVPASTLPFDTLQALVSGNPLGYEVLAGLAGALVAPYEAAGGLAGAVALPFETLQALVAAGTIPYEVLQALQQGQSALFETLGGVAQAIPVPYEADGIAVVIIRPRLHYPAEARVHRVADAERTRGQGAAPRTHTPSSEP